MAARAVAPAWPAGHLGKPGALVWRFDRRRDAVFLGGIALAILLVPAIELVTTWGRVTELAGRDFNLYLDAARRWLDGGPFYPPSQLTEVFPDDGNRILYPPTALVLLGPLAAMPRGLAAVLWWLFPITALGWQLVRMRPRPIAWPFLAMCVAWPPTLLSFAVWNSVFVFVGFLALATLNYWPAALIGLKPSILPFAFWGANHRSWWITVAVLGALSIPVAPLWFDWFRVLGNASQVGGIWHSIDQFPLFFWPILVWFARTRPAPGTIPQSTT